MNRDTFFEKFDQFADTPDAIDTLREVILQLAVSGRLVSQSTTDAPVDVGRLDEQAAPRKQAEGRSGASLEAVTEDEIAEEIPDSWVWMRLFRLCEPDAPIVYGILQPGPDVRPNGVPYVRPTEIKDGQIRLAEVRHTSREIAAQYTRATIRKGDVLLTIVGTLGATAIVPDELDGGNITQSSCRLRPDSRFIDTSYLVTCLRSRTLLSQYVAFSLGSAVQRLNIAHVRALAIPLPPLAEQKRIVAKVDELMALCDRLEEQLQERETQHAALARAALARFAEAPTPANLEFLFHNSYAISPAELRKSILTLAVQGKLVPQNPSDESAEGVANRLTMEFCEQAGPPIDEAELPWPLPASWKWVRLGCISGIKHGYAFSSKSFTSEPSPYVLTTPGNFYESGGFRDRGGNTKYFNGEVPPAFIFESGDLIVPMTEQAAGLLGSPAFIPEDGKTYLHNQRLGKLTFHTEEVSPDFVYWFFNSEFFRGELARTCTGMKVRHTSPKRILKVPFPVAPAAEQRRIVAKVNQLMELIERLESSVTVAQKASSNLLAALVKELTLLPRKLPNQQLARKVLSAEIVHRLHNEPTFGRVKHQKILHLCEHIAQLEEIGGRYTRQAAGPLDGRMIHAVEADLEKLEWYAEVPRESFGHAYRPLAKAGGHASDFAALWPDRAEQVQGLIELMRRWDTDKCELFATAYAAWNDLLIWGREPTDDAILHEILEIWHPDKQRFTRKRWKSMLDWIRREGYAPTGFGKATAAAN